MLRCPGYLALEAIRLLGPTPGPGHRFRKLQVAYLGVIVLWVLIFL